MIELAGLAGGSSHSDGTRTGEGLLNARLHLGPSSREFFAGLGGGRAWDGGAWRSVILGEIGASIDVGPGAALFTISPATVNDSLKYTDTQASLSWKRDRFDLGAVLGFRVGDRVTTTSSNARSWGSVTAIAWMTSNLGLAASGGTYPIDPTQGFPGGRFISLAIRIATNSAKGQPAITSGIEDDGRSALLPATVTEFSSQRASSDSVIIRVVARGARSVETTGDFNSWVPLLLAPDTRTADSWRVTLPMPSGKYQMNIRIDGGPWIVPPGVLSMLDEFGGSVGLLVVP
jgi:hypothetical protein